jgi:AbrB family looped-hinge helix DNA binding protein
MSEIAFARLSSKGQIVIPKELRDQMDLHEGQLFALYGKDDTLVARRIETPTRKELKDLLEWGAEYAKRKGITREDVNKAIKEDRKDNGKKQENQDCN